MAPLGCDREETSAAPHRDVVDDSSQGLMPPKHSQEPMAHVASWRGPGAGQYNLMEDLTPNP
jgi:hypothetical protein